MRVTISQIAEEAGVSTSTVSYALSGKRPVSEEVKKRINDVARQLNYRPSYAARMMHSSKTMCVGVAIDQCSNPTSGFFLEELGRLARSHQYHIILGISGGIAGEGEEIINHFSSGVVDGIINCLPEMSVNDAVRLSQGTPLVTYNRHHPASPAEPDYHRGINDLMAYLTSLGHQKIGFISIRQRSMGLNSDTEDPCLRGYRIYCQEHKMEMDSNMIVFGDGTFESGIALGQQLYIQGATAIFAGNDRVAAGILAWAHDEGIKIPDQLSVAGFDDSYLASACSPPLTTIQLPYAELARITFEVLMDRMNGREFEQKQIVPTNLIVRMSTGEVQKAMV